MVFALWSWKKKQSQSRGKASCSDGPHRNARVDPFDDDNDREGGELEEYSIDDMWQTAFSRNLDQHPLVPLIPFSGKVAPEADSFVVAARVKAKETANYDGSIKEKYIEDRLLHGYECLWSENARKQYLYGSQSQNGEEKRQRSVENAQRVFQGHRVAHSNSDRAINYQEMANHVDLESEARAKPRPVTRDRPRSRSKKAQGSSKSPKQSPYKTRRKRISKVSRRAMEPAVAKTTRSQELRAAANRARIGDESTFVMRKRMEVERVRGFARASTPVANVVKKSSHRRRRQRASKSPLSKNISTLAKSIESLRRDLNIFKGRNSARSPQTPAVISETPMSPTPRVAALEQALLDERRILDQRITETAHLEDRLKSTALNADEVIRQLKREHQAKMQSVQKELHSTLSSRDSQICLLRQDLQEEHEARIAAQMALEKLKFRIKCGEYGNVKVDDSIDQDSIEGSAIKIQNGFRAMVARRNYREAAARRAIEETGHSGEWSCCIDAASGYPYYYNSKTGKSSWERPKRI